MAKERKRVPNRERKRISLERLRELIRYDPETGVFSRISAPRPQAAYWIGKPVGAIKGGSRANGGGYLVMNVDGRTYRGHHIAWFYMTGEWPTIDIDHEDTDRANNRWDNLRIATRSQNLGNCRLPSNNTSGIKGVRFDSNRGTWIAQIGIGKCAKGYYYTKHLGRFRTKKEAAEAYRIAAEARFGKFARVA